MLTASTASSPATSTPFFPNVRLWEECNLVLSEVAGGLTADGWKVSLIQTESGVQIQFEHALSLGLSFLLLGHDVGNVSTLVREFLETDSEFEVVRHAPTSSANIRLLRKLRGAFDHPQRRSLPAVGWALFEEGILTKEEAEWLEDVDAEVGETGGRPEQR